MTETVGRYEIIEKIGQGGFAIVHRARDTQLDREVALKELRPILLDDAGWVRRFQREARAIAKLDHPHIVPIFDVYEADHRLFLVMRLVNGPSLDNLITAQARIPWETTLKTITRVASGLDYAHSQGILHRDLKPANILMDPDRGPMLTDFGLAKLAGEHSVSLSAGSSIVGTPHYIAPEVWEGKGSSVHSDIYALGCILFEMLTGDKVFKGTTPPVVMMAHFQPLSLPQTWPDGVPAGVSQVIKKALATNPAERYASAGELADALKKLATPAAAPRPEVGVRVAPRLADPLPPPGVVNLAGDDADDDGEVEPRSVDWRGFLSHLGPYVIVITGLGIINGLTTDYPWFLWPALGWGIGLALHLWSLIADSMVSLRGKWKDLLNHLASYVVVIGALAGMNSLTGNYPWFLWPAGMWGIALAIHIWTTLISRDSQSDMEREEESWRKEWKQQRREWKKQKPRKSPFRSGEQAAAPAQPQLASDSLQAHLVKARAYQKQIDELVRANTNRAFEPHLKDMAGQVSNWVASIEELAGRVDTFQRNTLIRHDLESVPRSIEKLESQLAAETDPATRSEIQRALQHRQAQLDALVQLQNTMKRAEIKIERTLSALGTIYPQILTGQSTNQVANYSRITSAVSEEVRALRDHLEALAEVKLGQADLS